MPIGDIILNQEGNSKRCKTKGGSLDLDGWMNKLKVQGNRPDGCELRQGSPVIKGFDRHRRNDMEGRSLHHGGAFVHHAVHFTGGGLFHEAASPCAGARLGGQEGSTQAGDPDHEDNRTAYFHNPTANLLIQLNPCQCHKFPGL